MYEAQRISAFRMTYILLLMGITVYLLSNQARTTRLWAALVLFIYLRFGGYCGNLGYSCMSWIVEQSVNLFSTASFILL